MIFIEREQTDPFYNIAAEEYVLKYFQEDVVMIWQSESSVICGKHQNIFKEINLPFTIANNIPVLRRLSGGGTVYHDLGNINYSLITTSEKKENLINFKMFTKPVITFLKTYGVSALLEGKNNLTISGLKISGNSGHVFKNKILHHGTLLFNSDLNKLEKSITPINHDINDKAINSVRKKVVNISEIIQNISKDDFLKKLKIFIKSYFNVNKTVYLNKYQQQEINKLADEKYKTKEWTYGYSPSYIFNNKTGDNYLSLKVKKGLIEEISIKGKLNRMEKQFYGKMHCPETIRYISNNFNKETGNELMKLFGFL